MLKHISIFMTTDENYARYVAISVASICHNTDAVCDIYLLCDNVSDESKRKISALSTKYKNCNIDYIDLTDNHRQYVRDTYLAHNKKQLYTTNLSNYSRFLMPDLMPNIHKALYMDTDIIVNGDILPLYETNLGTYPIGAVPCSYVLNWPGLREKTLKYLSHKHVYFNAGILLIDCDAWRKNNICEKIAECDRQIYNIKLFNTQDPLNKCFDCNYLHLSRKYNFDGTILYTDDVNEKNHIIRHFTATKPDMGPTKIASSDLHRFLYFARRTKFLPEIKKNMKWQYKIAAYMPHIFCIKWGGLCLFGLVRISKVKK